MGTVFAPNGKTPLYGISVYVPATTPQPFTPGVTCNRCTELSGNAITSATTDAQGQFVLENVPPGSDVPVVITSGKWRRIVKLPIVTECLDNPVADGVLSLPKNRSEGEMPRIAVTSGGCDALACILTKMGIDPAEFSDSSASDKAVVFYDGVGGRSPGAPQQAPALWENLDELKQYDIVLNSCECNEYNDSKTKPDVLRQYADLGGRVFGSHYHYTWSKKLIPEWKDTAVWASGGASLPDLVNTSFPEGQALADWLVRVGASIIPGQVTLGTKTHDASTVGPQTKRWLYSSGSPGTTHYLSFQTPVGANAGEQCGKVVYAGMHVSSGNRVDETFPAGCLSEIKPEENALVFLLFDLGACVDPVF